MMTNKRPMMDPENMPPSRMPMRGGPSSDPMHSEVGPILSVSKDQAPGVKVGDQVRVSGTATVTEAGDTVSLQMMDVSVEPDDQGEMAGGFDEGAAANEIKW